MCAIIRMIVPYLFAIFSHVILIGTVSLDSLFSRSLKLMMNKSVIRAIINEEGCVMKLFGT